MGRHFLSCTRKPEKATLAEMALKPEGDENGTSGNPQDADADADADAGPDLWKTESELRENARLHAERALTWRRRALHYEEAFRQAVLRHDDELAKLSSQLFLYEARMSRGWKDLCRQLSEREATIHRLQRVVRTLRSRLADAGISADVDDDEVDEPEPDSLDDSDSAVIMDEEPRRLRRQARCWNGDGVPVARSVSDTVDSQCKYSSLRRGNGFLRRPEVLETVYSVEEDSENPGSGSGNQNQGAASEESATPEALTDSPAPETPVSHSVPPVSRHGPRHHSTPETPRGRSDSTCFDSPTQSSGYFSGSSRMERSRSVSDAPDSSISASPVPSSQVTRYNRVMSNHRSVTKPKDVKYKRINKAKSKSLEELRGRLRNWVDKGTKVAFSVDQSYA